MATNVFANNNEIVSKGADGKSVAAFPDVCWTPPAPPVGPIPLPYPNSTEDKDLDNGTTTVQIKDKTVCMGDTSYIAKSKGDEGATQSQQKNMLTSAIQGKGYFITSSQDVKVEGKGATRHLDTMTHNHGSPAGTPGQGEVSGMGAGEAISSAQPEAPKPIEVKFLGVAIIREDTFREGTNIGTTYCFSTQEQINNVSSCDEIRTYCENAGLQVPDADHCVLSNDENNPELQVVNIAKYRAAVDNSTKQYLITYTKNNTRSPICSKSMVGPDVAFVLLFSGTNISKHVTMQILRNQGETYSQSEKQKNCYNYGFSDGAQFVDTLKKTISTNISIMFSVHLDLAKSAKYIISVEDSTSTKFSCPTILSYKKMYYGLYYDIDNTSYKNDIINFCTSIKTLLLSLSKFVDLECIRTENDPALFSRKNIDYIGKAIKKIQSVGYVYSPEYIPIFVLPDSMLEKQNTIPLDFYITIGSANNAEHIAYMNKSVGDVASSSIGGNTGVSLKVDSISEVQSGQGITLTPVLSHSIPRITEQNVPGWPDVELIIQGVPSPSSGDVGPDMYAFFLSISQTKITNGLSILNTTITNEKTYRIQGELTYKSYMITVGFRSDCYANQFIVIGYHNLVCIEQYPIRYATPPNNTLDIVAQNNLEKTLYHEIGHALGLVSCNRENNTEKCSGYPCNKLDNCRHHKNDDGILHIHARATNFDGHANWYTRGDGIGPHCSNTCVMSGLSPLPSNSFCSECEKLLMKAPMCQI